MKIKRLCIKSRTLVYGYSKMPDRVRKVKYPTYGYNNTLNGNRVDQTSKLRVWI